VIRVTATEKVDNILFARKLEYKTRVEELFARMVNAADCGVQIEYVTLLRAFPPSRTKAAFDEATAAGNASSELRSKALTYRVETENETGAKAAEIIAAARAYKSRIVADMKAETEYFKAINAKYKESPRTVLIALYTAALSEAMQASTEDRFIMGSNNRKRQIRVQLNPEPKNQPKPKAEEGKEGK
jgi:membrane protease subunit HflK